MSSSLIGRTIDDRFRIDALLGEGAVGAVYRVVELESGRVLALKKWDASVMDPQVRGRFLREINALIALDHPNIVKVYGHGMVDRVPYMVLEYLEGQTVDSLLRDGEPLEAGLAIEIARQALTAIAYAHQQNVVHRDLKPENMFLVKHAGGPPQVKILDYGLAKFMAATGDPAKDKTLTSTGMVVGTPLYMPPEQATGASVDLPVDVYAMGCVLFELLTGRLPYLGESRFDLLTAHMREPVPRLQDVCPGVRVAPALQAIIDRALAKKQTERFPDAGSMLAALERLPANPMVRAAAPVHARRASDRAPARGTRPAATSGGPPVLLAVGAVVLVVFGLLFLLMR